MDARQWIAGQLDHWRWGRRNRIGYLRLYVCWNCIVGRRCLQPVRRCHDNIEVFGCGRLLWLRHMTIRTVRWQAECLHWWRQRACTSTVVPFGIRPATKLYGYHAREEDNWLDCSRCALVEKTIRPICQQGWFSKFGRCKLIFSATNVCPRASISRFHHCGRDSAIDL